MTERAFVGLSKRRRQDLDLGLRTELGEALGVGAHLAALQRMASGAFTLENAVPLDILLTTEYWQRFLLPPETALAHFGAVHLDAENADHIVHGRSVAASAAGDNVLARAYGPDGSFIAILRGAGSCWKPHKVFLPQN